MFNGVVDTLSKIEVRERDFLKNSFFKINFKSMEYFINIFPKNYCRNMLIDIQECKIECNIGYEVDSDKRRIKIENISNIYVFISQIQIGNTIINVKQHEVKNRQVKTIDES